jgi:hypothetical protein
MAGFSGSGVTDSGTNFLELCLVDFFVHRGEQTCLWSKYAPCWTRASHTRSTIGTELAFSEDVKWAPFSLLSWRMKVIESRTATFRQVNTHIPRVHHDTLEFADGACVLLPEARHFAGLAFAGQEPSRFRSPAQAGLSFEALVMCAITPHSSLCRRLARKSLGQI